MNRIILIGNGFDKAHGLPTGYNDFFEYYWQQKVNEMTRTKPANDALCSFRGPMTNDWSPIVDEYDNADSLNNFFKELAKYKSFTISLSPFFNTIKTEYESMGWVDIENKYYQVLTAILDNKYKVEYPNVEVLNEQLKSLKGKLIKYLLEIQNERLKDDILIPRIKRIIYEPFRAKDISVSGREKFNEFIKNKWEEDIKSPLLNIKRYDISYAVSDFDFYKKEDIAKKAQAKGKSDVDIHLDRIYDRKDSNCQIDVNKRDGSVLDYYLLPDSVMLLTFNYTKTVDLYLPNDRNNVEINHIHGELTNPDSIIFGYGDDTDEDYARIEKLNNNAYMNNIKAFNYLGSANYRRMLEFIESAPYQIYVMGHSCGISDRTLLNTLFEHDNCISIKPYYYQKKDGLDNYIEIVQNISRNFKSRPKMRDRVVNKTFCEPLPQSDLKTDE